MGECVPSTHEVSHDLFCNAHVTEARLYSVLGME